ncbi:Autophagy-related protein 18a, partial [Durusdinium trenchii]
RPESYHDQSSIIQFQGFTRSDPCATEINTGNCVGNQACKDCRPQGDGKIPSGTRFPNGYLKCEGDPVGVQACFGMLENDFYEFRSSSDYLICDGEGTCKGDWNVNNVGSVCCTAAVDDTQACNNAAKLNLTTDPDSGCTQDVCCDCDQACCYESFFTGVNSLSCLGGTSCTQSRFEIQRNLFCSSTSKRTGNTKQGACVSGDDNYPLGFGFVFDDFGDHCVTCEGEDTCQGANFWFEKPGSGISMTCDGKGFATACESSSTVIGLFGDSCLHLTCVELAIAIHSRFVKWPDQTVFAFAPGTKLTQMGTAISWAATSSANPLLWAATHAE